MLIALAVALLPAVLLPQDTTARPPTPTPTPTPALAIGVRVAPETVTVGLPFRVTVHVRAPRGARIVFPEEPDTSAGGTVQALDPSRVYSGPDTLATDATAIYRLAAWDLGTQPLRLPNIVVELPAAGRDPSPNRRALSLWRSSVFVRAVTPRDSALRVPKPARGYIGAPRPWWFPLLWLLAALAAAVVLWRLWVWWRRRTRAPVAIDPLALAEQAFERVDRLGLLEAGERAQYVALIVEVVREYLARRIPAASPALTSTELLAALRADPRIPMDRLGAVLSESDLVKFARQVVTAQHARELATVARTMVRDVDGAARAAAAAAAAAAAEARERAA